MKLTFLGSRYEAPNNEMATIETEQTARFLGNAYKVRTSPQTASRHNESSMTYRGVRY